MPLRVIVILYLYFTANGQHEYMRYKDPLQPLTIRVKDLLKRMTLAEKIGQMTQIERNVSSANTIKQFFIGGLVSGGGSYPSSKAAPVDWVNMINTHQRAAMSTRLGIPLIYGIDAVHGHNTAYKATIFPHNIGLGVTRDPNLVKKIGAATALELRATGIPYTFAPCIAVCRDPRWGRCYESYSEDYKIVQEMTDIILGLQGEIPIDYPKKFPSVGGRDKVAACVKHFVGDGGTQNGIDANNTIIDQSGLFEIHMPAYADAIDRGVSTVMISYSSWNGEKMHTNHPLITNYLKNQLKFRGFTISDWEGVQRITSPAGSNYSHSVKLAVEAGIDMVMEPTHFLNFIGNLTNLVNTNVIPMSRIDDAVSRILRVKFILGLFENPYADTGLADKLGCQEHRDLSREAVRKSLVLLKNGQYMDEPVIPIPKTAAKILVAGTHADNLGYQCGGWTMEWQGVSGNDFSTGTTILAAIKSSVDPRTEVIFLETPEASFVKSGNFSQAIVVVGEHPYAENEGDSANLTLPELALTAIQNVCGNMKCVVVLITGRPVVIEPFLPSIDALVAAWLPGTEGHGITDLLFGDYGFTGTLARTWFKSVEQLPMNVGDEHYDPLFPFGFGLMTQPLDAIIDSK